MSELTEELLREQNFRNLVQFFAPQLRAVLRGAHAYKQFGLGQRRTLRADGILVALMHSKGKKLTVSPEAQALLASKTS